MKEFAIRSTRNDIIGIYLQSPRRCSLNVAGSLAKPSFDYPAKYFEEIAHAIEVHSFSANIEIKTLEAKIVQDADRLDGLGAIGIVRCFATAGLLKRPFYCPDDPFCDLRTPDDSQFTVDHFFKKLFKTAETLKTNAGTEEGKRRIRIMKDYLDSLSSEINC